MSLQQQFCFSLALALCLAINVVHAETCRSDAEMWEDILQGTHRDTTNVARDSFRHPMETLQFFAVQCDMTVVEIWPGRGWYTEILAPLLYRGTLVAAHWPAESENMFFRETRAAFDAKLAGHAVYERTRVSPLLPPSHQGQDINNSADRVLTFRNVHNWMKSGTDQQMFDIFYRMLKPGGILGVVEHRASTNTTYEDMVNSGYVTEAHVIALAEKAGFLFEKRSEINANSLDNRQHPAGVWSLPPTLRLGDVNRETYLAIGESDRMTLRFRKPFADSVEGAAND